MMYILRAIGLIFVIAVAVVCFVPIYVIGLAMDDKERNSPSGGTW